LAEQVTL